MSIDEAIAKYKEITNTDANCPAHCNISCDKCVQESRQLAEWLEKLKYIEDIILKWNADWYNDDDNGIPDNEILEAIFNACNDNGFYIQIDEDYREGCNKAIDDFVQVVKKHDWNIRNRNENEFIYGAIDRLAEQLKEGGVDEV